tara:strand:+ start:789 stop:1070 length:282 start_codon:yes stop_codon:yes gene_type:complete
MPNYSPDLHVERCSKDDCKRPVERGLGVNKKTGIKYLTYLEYCKQCNKEGGRIMPKLKTYKILVKFDATDEKDAEDFVYDMQPKDWLQHLEEE